MLIGLASLSEADSEVYLKFKFGESTRINCCGVDVAAPGASE